ncbi:hypothetical protein RUM44_010259 [Polyplax serrata]
MEGTAKYLDACLSSMQVNSEKKHTGMSWNALQANDWTDKKMDSGDKRRATNLTCDKKEAAIKA